MLKLFPGLWQIFHYRSSHFQKDLAAGVIVACLIIPQSMAYAVIAGVPVVYGLFAAIVPTVVYALVGNSRYLSVGPVAIVSLLAFSSVSLTAQAQTQHFLTMIVLLTLIVGAVQILLGLVKFGNFFDLISPAVIKGFISAAAIIIGLTQIQSLIGITVPSYQNFFTYIINVIEYLPDIHFWTMSIGIGCLALLLIMKTLFRISLGPLIAMISSSVFVGVLQLHQSGVEVIGEIPQALPTFSLQLPGLSSLFALLPSAFMIAFLSFAESYAVGKTLAANDRESLHPNQELIGLGLANIMSSFAGAIPVAGGISRTAVNHQAGAKSNVASLITVAFVIITLLYLTPFLYFLPETALAAIIIVAVSNLVDIKGFRYFIKNEPASALLMLITFIATLMVDIFFGLLAGIFLSLVGTFFKTKMWSAT